MIDSRTPRRLIGGFAAAAALGALAGPATASQVQAKTGHYAESKKNVVVVTFDLVGSTVKHFWHSDTCATFNVPVPDMKVGTGDFSYNGAGIKNGIDQEFTVSVRGKVRAASKITGTMTYEKTKGNGPACKTTTKFSAKRTGKPRA
jgi:hypothetical protein